MAKNGHSQTSFKRINDKNVIFLHLYADILAIVLCHVIFINNYRLPYHDIFDPLLPKLIQPYSVLVAIVFICLLWLFAFYISGHYSNTARKSGLQIIGPTFVTSFIISILLFFLLVSYSSIDIENIALELSLRYLSIAFLLVFSFRMLIIMRLQYLLKAGRLGYKLLLVGSNKQAWSVIKDVKDKEKLKETYLGYLKDVDGKVEKRISKYLPCIGDVNQINRLIGQLDIDEAIVCLEHSELSKINFVINTLRQKQIIVRLATDINALIEGTVKTQNLESFPYITIGINKIPVWQRLFKRIFDFTMAWIGLIISVPICIILSIGIKSGSKGPILYKQERVGKHQKPFTMYKFRSMLFNAEKDGPALASANDDRITSLGKFMRKWRLDELPQFINVILGDMSFVGPRPERRFFIDQITPKAPHYNLLFTVKPGITSWGMVKFGYAEDVDQMIERLQYDILYLENRTLVIDFKIMLFTLKTLILGEGK